MERHHQILAALFIAVGVCGLIGVPFVLIPLVGAGLATGEWSMMLFLPGLGAAISLLILLFSVPTLIAGVGLLQRKPWAGKAALVMAAVNLLNFPFGTPVGVYGLWVLSRRESERLLAA